MTRVASAFALSIIRYPHTRDKCPSTLTAFSGIGALTSVKAHSVKNHRKQSSWLYGQGRSPEREPHLCQVPQRYSEEGSHVPKDT